MISIIFTKNRSLQLEGYLNSYFYYTDAKPEDTYLVTPNKNTIDSKNNIIRDCIIRYENDFRETLRTIVDEAYDDESILLGVDDFVWFKPFNLEIAKEELHKNRTNTVGFTLRLGSNIYPYDMRWNLSNDPKVIVWDWRNKPTHFGYPFDISQSIYKAKLLKEILNLPNPIRLPNDLESVGVQYIINKKQNELPYYMCMNTESYGGCVDINRVQNIYKNKVQGTDKHAAESLERFYKDGFKLNWSNYYNFKPTDCFIGTERLQLYKDMTNETGSN